MDSAIQVDLARSEATAEEVLNTSLGEASSRLSVPRADSPLQNSPLQSQNQNPRRSSKGGYVTTNQIRLNPKKPSRDPSPSTSIQNAPGHTLELGNFDETANVVTLQSADEGFGAWSYVASAFSMFIVVWGFPQAFPVFQTFLSTGDAAKHPGSIVLPLLAPGIQDIEEGILFQVFPKPAKYRRIMVMAGISTMMLAVILASCADTAWQIVLTQGVLFGIGGIMLNFVHVSIFSEWFDKRKGEAMGIIWLGYRVGALVFPLICQWLLDKHGYETTLRVLIAPMLALLVPSMVLFRGRYPATAMLAKPAHPQVSKLAALRTPSVMFYLLITLLFSFVVNVPKMFITTFAADLKLDTSDRALALSLHMLCNMLGTYGCGWLSDSVFYDGLIGGCAVSTSLAHFLIWGFAKTKFGLFMYAIASGLASGGFVNCLFSFYSEVSGKNGELFTAIHSLFSFFRGIAILSVGPVGTSILQRSPKIAIDAYAIGKYKYLVAYAGGMSMASGILVLLQRPRRKFLREKLGG